MLRPNLTPSHSLSITTQHWVQAAHVSLKSSQEKPTKGRKWHSVVEGMALESLKLGFKSQLCHADITSLLVLRFFICRMGIIQNTSELHQGLSGDHK